MDLNDLQQLVAWLEASDLRSLELSRPGEHIKLTLSTDDQVMVSTADTSVPAFGREASVDVTVFAESAGIFVATHPMRSTPLTKVGDLVRTNDVLGLLKIGRIYAPVRAPIDGVVTQILTADGTLVGFGTPMLRMVPASDVAEE